MTKQEIIDLINTGKFFTVEFVKRTTGQLRRLNGRTVPPKPDGKPAYNFTHHNLIVVWDVKKHQYRSVPIENIVRINANHRTYEFTN
jgi:hypothetical protein